MYLHHRFNAALLLTVIYDMDGVLLDSEPLHVEAERLACAVHGFTPTEETWCRTKGKRAVDVFNELKRSCGVEHPASDVLIATKEEAYCRLVAKATPLPGALKAVDAFRHRYGRVGLATSSGRTIQRATFAALGISPDAFAAIVTGDDVTSGKPAPDAYVRAASLLGVPPERCAVIEDSDNGVTAGVRAGCTVIGITTSFSKDVLYAAGATFVFDTHDEIVAALTA